MKIKPPLSPLHVFLLVSGLVLLALSGIAPFDRTTWLLEVAPAIAASAVLVATYRRFPLSNLAYVLIWVHALILIVGGHWTYAENPLFAWLKDAMSLERNYYDRLGHVAQGFIPAIIVREVLMRTSPLKGGKWLFVLVVAFCLGVSAMYELLEWAAALGLGQDADMFLATQGDQWDTQWDMFLCLMGATVSLVTLSRLHDRSLNRVAVHSKPNEVQTVA